MNDPTASPEPPRPRDRHPLDTTDSIAKIAAALAKAQGEFTAIEKTATARIKSDKADYTFKYAPLDEVLASVRPVLSKHEIALVQIVDRGARGDGTRLRTALLHASGEVIASDLELKVVPTEAKALGGLITYLRRYSILALIGVAAEDDDDAGDDERTRGRGWEPVDRGGGNGHPNAPRDERRAATPPPGAQRSAEPVTERADVPPPDERRAAQAITPPIDTPPVDAPDDRLIAAVIGYGRAAKSSVLANKNEIVTRSAEQIFAMVIDHYEGALAGCVDRTDLKPLVSQIGILKAQKMSPQCQELARKMSALYDERAGAPDMR